MELDDIGRVNHKLPVVLPSQVIRIRLTFLNREFHVVEPVVEKSFIKPQYLPDIILGGKTYLFYDLFDSCWVNESLKTRIDLILLSHSQ